MNFEDLNERLERAGWRKLEEGEDRRPGDCYVFDGHLLPLYADFSCKVTSTMCQHWRPPTSSSEPEPLRCMCPTCNGEVVMREDPTYGSYTDVFYSYCKTCVMCGPRKETKESAEEVHRKIAALTRAEG